MAEDKTFRYGLIVLGFFLVTIGMFIMSVDKPQVYITFCTLGVLTTAVGIIWSMCQCYPKLTFVPMETESEKFLSHKPAVSIENEIPEKSCSQTAYTSQEEANVYEKSLPSYEQIQMKAKDSVERPGVQTAPLLGDCELKTGGCTHLFVQAKAEIHRISENDGETPQDPASQMVTATVSSPSKSPRSAAPLASFQEDIDPPSSEGSISSSQFLGGSTYSLRNSLPSQGHPEKHSSEPPRYEDFALIDSLLVERRNLSQEPTLALSQNYLSATASPSHFALATGPGSKVADSREIQCVEEEDDMYYGLKEGPENLLIAEDFVFEPET
ncbi:barttin [Emydura macquarii macquarii]|uniref:barttin n=1 Tax=Emydura macquarii macquarii TaxID=1129001 RepID=UPI003529DEEF